VGQIGPTREPWTPSTVHPLVMAPGSRGDLRCRSWTRTRPGPTQRPSQGLSAAEAARILGVRAGTVHQWVAKGVLPKSVKWQRYGLDRTDVENLALQRYTPGHPWFATNREAAQILGISRERVKQLVDTGRLPCVEYRGRRYFRRQQVQVIANARNARWH
jgi:excisionase family DNA binding protein